MNAKRERKSYKVVDNEIMSLILIHQDMPFAIMKSCVVSKLSGKYGEEFVIKRFQNVFKVKKYNGEQKKFILDNYEKKTDFCKYCENVFLRVWDRNR